jgi:hypothetical protein
MQVADTPEVEEAMQRSLANESTTILHVDWYDDNDVDDKDLPALTVADARRIMDCARENTRFRTVYIYRFDIINTAVMASHCAHP